ncbi:hypothetical protein MACK_004129 [Theileria orientalis]|uniref:Uncharacterized protein n=1 Tax=Theileria orientalis TaxID=68886 RepID=A0A976SJZ4_THEOR|nr:hypothetical protein MACK_004129 [Theileria orientalis]
MKIDTISTYILVYLLTCVRINVFVTVKAEGGQTSSSSQRAETQSGSSATHTSTPKNGVDLNIKSDTKTKDKFVYEKVGEYVTYTAKDNNAFKLVKDDKTEVWKATDANSYSTRVEVEFLANDGKAVTIYLDDKTKIFIKESGTQSFAEIDTTKVNAKSININYPYESYFYKNEFENNIRTFTAKKGFAFKGANEYVDNNKVEIWKTDKESEYANKIVNEGGNKVTIHIGEGTSASTKVFNKGTDGKWTEDASVVTQEGQSSPSQESDTSTQSPGASSGPRARSAPASGGGTASQSPITIELSDDEDDDDSTKAKQNESSKDANEGASTTPSTDQGGSSTQTGSSDSTQPQEGTGSSQPSEGASTTPPEDPSASTQSQSEDSTQGEGGSSAGQSTEQGAPTTPSTDQGGSSTQSQSEDSTQGDQSGTSTQPDPSASSTQPDPSASSTQPEEKHLISPRQSSDTQPTSNELYLQTHFNKEDPKHLILDLENKIDSPFFNCTKQKNTYTYLTKDDFVFRLVKEGANILHDAEAEEECAKKVRYWEGEKAVIFENDGTSRELLLNICVDVNQKRNTGRVIYEKDDWEGIHTFTALPSVFISTVKRGDEVLWSRDEGGLYASKISVSGYNDKLNIKIGYQGHPHIQDIEDGTEHLSDEVSYSFSGSSKCDKVLYNTRHVWTCPKDKDPKFLHLRKSGNKIFVSTKPKFYIVTKGSKDVNDATKYYHKKVSDDEGHYFFNRRAMCTEVGIDGEAIWKHSVGTYGGAYPKAVSYYGNDELVVTFSEFSLTFNRYRGKWRCLSAGSLVASVPQKSEDHKKVSEVTTPAASESDKATAHPHIELFEVHPTDPNYNVELDKSKYSFSKDKFTDNVFNYSFNDDSRCTLIKHRGTALWHYDTSVDDRQYPKSLIYDASESKLALKLDLSNIFYTQDEDGKWTAVDPDLVLFAPDPNDDDNLVQLFTNQYVVTEDPNNPNVFYYNFKSDASCSLVMSDKAEVWRQDTSKPDSKHPFKMKYDANTHNILLNFDGSLVTCLRNDSGNWTCTETKVEIPQDVEKPDKQESQEGQTEVDLSSQQPSGESSKDAKEGESTQPQEGTGSSQPSEGASTTPPEDPSGSSTQPDQSGSSTQPDQSGSSTQPDPSGSSTQPDQSGSSTQPDQSGSSTQPKVKLLKANSSDAANPLELDANEYTSTQSGNVVTYQIAGGVKCVQLIFGDVLLWAHDPNQRGGKYPKSVYHDTSTDVILLRFEGLDITFAKNTNGDWVYTESGPLAVKFHVVDPNDASKTVELASNQLTVTTDGDVTTFNIAEGVNSIALTYGPALLWQHDPNQRGGKHPKSLDYDKSKEMLVLKFEGLDITYEKNTKGNWQYTETDTYSTRAGTTPISRSSTQPKVKLFKVNPSDAANPLELDANEYTSTQSGNVVTYQIAGGVNCVKFIFDDVLMWQHDPNQRGGKYPKSLDYDKSKEMLVLKFEGLDITYEKNTNGDWVYTESGPLAVKFHVVDPNDATKTIELASNQLTVTTNGDVTTFNIAKGVNCVKLMYSYVLLWLYDSNHHGGKYPKSLDYDKSKEMLVLKFEGLDITFAKNDQGQWEYRENLTVNQESIGKEAGQAKVVTKEGDQAKESSDAKEAGQAKVVTKEGDQAKESSDAKEAGQAKVVTKEGDQAKESSDAKEAGQAKVVTKEGDGTKSEGESETKDASQTAVPETKPVSAPVTQPITQQSVSDSDSTTLVTNEAGQAKVVTKEGDQAKESSDANMFLW